MCGARRINKDKQRPRCIEIQARHVPSLRVSIDPGESLYEMPTYAPFASTKYVGKSAYSCLLVAENDLVTEFPLIRL